MSNRYIFGFVGYDAYDILYYLGRTLNELGAKSLLVDYSYNKALSLTFPKMLEKGEVAYRYNLAIANELQLSEEITNEYDYVFLYFGDNLKHQSITLCDEIYLVSDYKLHNIMKLNEVALTPEQCRFLVLRDKIGSKISVKYVQELLPNLNINDNNSFLLEDSYNDLEVQLFCQYNSEFSMNGLSASMHSLIIEILCSEYLQKDISVAIKRASKR